MARTWLQIRVDLVGGGPVESRDPGRILLVGPGHTFQGFAAAINQAFARWDLSHLHEFELPDGRKIGYPDDEFAPEMVWEDHAVVKVAEAVRPGDEFVFTYDFGDNWRHRCRVFPEKTDPREELGGGPLPRQPVAIWGWGWIPDQYGRESAADLDLDP